MTRRKISILGATGSVGTSTLDLVERQPDRFEVVALTAASKVDALPAGGLSEQDGTRLAEQPAGGRASVQPA